MTHTYTHIPAVFLVNKNQVEEVLDGELARRSIRWCQRVRLQEHPQRHALPCHVRPSWWRWLSFVGAGTQASKRDHRPTSDRNNEICETKESGKVKSDVTITHDTSFSQEAPVFNVNVNVNVDINVNVNFNSMSMSKSTSTTT